MVMVENAPLSLHVPEPEVRPGGTPDFSNVPIPKAGSVPRPAVDVDPREIRDLAYSIIRVLNREGEAVGPGRVRSAMRSCSTACAT
jgi:2-oxoisovalerate dehydrogenase E1 component alpha subunit